MTLDSIDFAALYREQMQRASWAPRPARVWDGRAADYKRGSGGGRYAADFIARMDLSGARTLLDVGSGAGTLALPLARRLDRVLAIDSSQGMLAALREHAADQGVDNVETRHCAWEDDWSEVPVCDIAVASRSTAVADLGAALEKLASRARLRAYLTYLVGGHFIDVDILRRVGPVPPPLPDHLLLLGMLHRMSIHPRVDYLETPSRLAGSADFDDFARRLAGTIGGFDDAARADLRRWYDASAGRAKAGGAPMRWAFVSWESRTGGVG